MAYQITEIVTNNTGKFACMVKFNGGTPEYYEVESDDPATIDATLAKVDTDKVAASIPSNPSVSIDGNGKIVV
jgi:hypothetical protein